LSKRLFELTPRQTENFAGRVHETIEDRVSELGIVDVVSVHGGRSELLSHHGVETDFATAWREARQPAGR
jgi:hypothetical protein